MLNPEPGTNQFRKKVKSLPGFEARGRNVIEGGAGIISGEESAPYTALLRAEKDDRGPENAYFWDTNTE